MTDATDKLFTAVRALMHQPSFGDDSLSGQHERAKLLEAVDEYVNSESRVRETWEAWNRQVALLEAKARVCNAILASDVDLPCINDPKVQAAVDALRELEKTR